MHHVPNVITVVRVALIVPTAWLLLRGDYMSALLLIALAGASDALDGALARRYAWTTRFGAFADPLADKLLVATTFVVLVLQGHVPLWLAIIAIARDVVIMGGALAYRLKFQRVEIDPTFISRANTAVQIVMLIAVLVKLIEVPPASAFAAALIDPWGFALVALLSITSGLDYVITWGTRAGRQWRQSP